MLGSGKANAGHAETAAGMTGLMKLLLELRYQQTSSNAQLRIANPHVAGNLGGWRCATPTQHGGCSAIESDATGGVSSIRLLGTIVHAVLRGEKDAPRSIVSKCRFRRVAYWWHGESQAKLAEQLRPQRVPSVELVAPPLYVPPVTDGSLINLRMDVGGRHAVIELNDSQRFNTIGGALGEDLRLAVAWIRSKEGSIRASRFRRSALTFARAATRTQPRAVRRALMPSPRRSPLHSPAPSSCARCLPSSRRAFRAQ